ncbi:MAG TPA: malto-oligosyltrehalose trehalohydrolase [Methylomirabilota bacterium]|nr:malto-oligosyltrehalose trehalohydrolase [Methylomirabilota bacterium]
MTDDAAATRIHTMHFGPSIGPDGTRFRFWAPKMRRPRLAVEGRASVPMEAMRDGWFEAVVDAGPGSRYRFLLDDGMAVPDPASRFQPDGPHGPSVVVDPEAYRWRNAAWRGRPWPETVLYEMHVGAFTREGTYAAAAERLDHLEALGVTAVELMPLSTFAGEWGWGYDGVLPFAPHAPYGGPDDLKAFIDAAHGRGLQVMLDVVYNHFGPDGNYMPLYAPVFTHKHASPWGDGVNVDDEGSRAVREFFIENAAYWIDEYFIDGLRLDAVQAIKDDSPVHLLAELARKVRSAARGRHVHLVVENAENDADWIVGSEQPADRYDAQWNDDIHHVLHVALTGEDGGYYAGFAEETGLLERAVMEGFARQGQPISGGSPLGKPSGHLPPTAFVSYLQNHDQVGNRALGERITRTVGSAEPVRVAAALYLLAPQIPLVFMGEEWAATTPFPFFCDFTGDLGDAVRRGRRDEFSHFPDFSHPEILALIPDPLARETFEAAKLDWREPEDGRHREMLGWYTRVLAVRHAEIVPLLPLIARGGASVTLGPQAFEGRWDLAGGGALAVAANLSADPVRFIGDEPMRTIWCEGAVGGGSLGPWTVRWSLAR